MQKDPITLYNSKSRKAFVTWQEAGVVLSYHVEEATRPLCDPPCMSRWTCALQDTCVSSTGGEYSFVPSAFVFFNQVAEEDALSMRVRSVSFRDDIQEICRSFLTQRNRFLNKREHYSDSLMK